MEFSRFPISALCWPFHSWASLAFAFSYTYFSWWLLRIYGSRLYFNIYSWSVGKWSLDRVLVVLAVLMPLHWQHTFLKCCNTCATVVAAVVARAPCSAHKWHLHFEHIMLAEFVASRFTFLPPFLFFLPVTSRSPLGPLVFFRVIIAYGDVHSTTATTSALQVGCCCWCCCCTCCCFSCCEQLTTSYL